MTAPELNPELRTLIDDRLDAIDRALWSAQVSWSERRSIVGEVETQVFELLFRRNAVPTRDDVLGVLESLDPPELYIPEEQRGRVRAVQSKVKPTWSLQQLAGRSKRFMTLVVAGAALVVVNTLIVLALAASHGVIPWLVTLAGLAWLNYAGLRQLRARSREGAGGFLGDLRQGLAAWILPKNGVQGA